VIWFVQGEIFSAQWPLQKRPVAIKDRQPELKNSFKRE
jgi:hypothetical protein